MKVVSNFLLCILLFPLVLLFSCQDALQYEPDAPQFTKGWSIKEPSGLQWSLGTISTIVLYENKLETKKRKLILKGSYFKKERPSQLFLNNDLLGNINFDKKGTVQFDIILSNNSLPDSLKFKHFDIRSPLDYGMSNDNRQLKLSIDSILLK